MFTESLDTTYNESFPWVDITSHSFGTVGGVPLGLALGPDEDTKAAAERGQTGPVRAGNGVGNAFDVPQITYGSGETGNDWTITVGAIRRDNQRAIVGDGIPVEISAWGDGNLPSGLPHRHGWPVRLRWHVAATPYTAGIFGTVLTRVRQALGDAKVGQRSGQVVAEGAAIPGSVFLSDGKLTRSELRDAVLKTAFPLNQDNTPSTFPYPLTAPYINAETNVLFEGYGAATPEGAKRAVDVILGRAVLPTGPSRTSSWRSRSVKDTLYGGFDRDGDGDQDFEGLTGSNLRAVDATNLDYALYALRLGAKKVQAPVTVPQQTLGQNALTFYLHQHFTAEPGVDPSCVAVDTERYMDTSDTTGDLECFDAPRDQRGRGLPSARDLRVQRQPRLAAAGGLGRVRDDLHRVGHPGGHPADGVLVATDREIGTGQGNFAPVIGTGQRPRLQRAGQRGPRCRWLRHGRATCAGRSSTSRSRRRGRRSPASS
jgi:hypothetical protein